MKDHKENVSYFMSLSHRNSEGAHWHVKGATQFINSKRHNMQAGTLSLCGDGEMEWD